MAEKAFSTWSIPVPKARRYYEVVVDELERDGGLEALHDAIRDPLGVYRHNVATHARIVAGDEIADRFVAEEVEIVAASRRLDALEIA